MTENRTRSLASIFSRSEKTGAGDRGRRRKAAVVVAAVGLMLTCATASANAEPSSPSSFSSWFDKIAPGGDRSADAAKLTALHTGSKGKAVKEVQRRLAAHGYPVTVDGSYGTRTAYAVQDFQRDHNLASSGTVDSTTRAALLKAPKKSSRPAARLTNAQAVSRLRAAGITWESSNGCMDKDGRGCTSFTDILAPTLDLAIDLKKRSGCTVVITGAAEVHPHGTKGTRTHGHGYKIDIRPNPCIDTFIADHMFRHGFRGKDPRWNTRSAEYVLEHPKNGTVHWDIKYTL